MNLSALPASGRRRQKQAWRVGCLVGFFAWSGVLTGAHAAPPDINIFRGDFHPDNIYANPIQLPPDLRRVAVLPVAAEIPGDLADACAPLTPIIREQLINTKKFEVVSVDPIALRRATGQVNWTGTEALPADFFGFMRREYGCDGVLFVDLTAYRAYAPLAIGWRFKLVDLHSNQIVWAADELFDASRPSVRHAAQRFGQSWLAGWLDRDEHWMALNSPRQFGRYSAATLLKTLPAR